MYEVSERIAKSCCMVLIREIETFVMYMHYGVTIWEAIVSAFA